MRNAVGRIGLSGNLKVKSKKDLNVLRRLLNRCWSQKTSASPAGWTPERPSFGQCAITALIVQDEFGGTILRGVRSDGESHYWNLVKDKQVDLTADQFPIWEPLEGELRTREYLLGNENTRSRYEELRQQLDDLL